MKNIYLPSLLILFITACTTIEIKESDVFDNHQTITPASFSYQNLLLSEHTVPSSDDVDLNVWLFKRDDAKATILYTGGNGFLMVKSYMLISSLSELPVNIVLFDYRGYGQSSGTPTISGLKSDSEAVYKFISKDPELSSVPLIIHGHSMGSFLASYLADTHGADALVLESPISNPDHWTSNLLPFFLKPFIRFSVDEAIAKEDNMAVIERWQKPLLILIGDSDDITPAFMSERLFELSSSEYKNMILFENGGHNDLPKYEKYRDAYRELIVEL